MNKMIACCGINCETCEARIATIKNDDKMRVDVEESLEIIRTVFNAAQKATARWFVSLSA